MKRSIVLTLAALGLVSATAIATHAQDYRCQKPGGCLAQIPENGQLKTVEFRRGDLISTNEGWIVNPNAGWKKIRTGTTAWVESPLL